MMAVKTLGAVLRGKTAIESLFERSNGDRQCALALLVFMRYAEDNAETLGLVLDPDEPRQEDIVEACARLGENRFYSRDTIKPEKTWSNIAVQLGIDSRGFGDFLANISDRSLAEACSYCDLEPGQLSLENQGAILLAIRALRASIASLFDDIDHIPRTYADIITAIAFTLVENEASSSFCVPAVGQADLASSLARGVGAWQGSEDAVSIAAFSHDTDLQVLASMVCLMENGEASGARVSVALSNPLDSLSALSDAVELQPYSAALADWSAFRSAYYRAPRPKGGSEELLDSYRPWIERVLEEALPKGKSDLPGAKEVGAAPLVSGFLPLRLLSIVDEQHGCALAIVESHCNSNWASDYDLRRVLVEGNVLDAVIEFEHIEGQSDRSGQGTALWVLRYGRLEGEDILLAHLGGDGFEKLCDNLCGEGWSFYDNLKLPMNDNPVARRIVEMAIEHEPIDMVSTAVKSSTILSTDDCSFRFASYQDSVDLDARFARKAKSWGELQKRLVDCVEMSRECDEIFYEALSAFDDLELQES